MSNRSLWVACGFAFLMALFSGSADAQPIPVTWRPPTTCSTGQALVWNGSAWTCGTAGVDGSGTGGRSTRWSDADTLADGAFTDDGTNAVAQGTLGVNGQLTLLRSAGVAPALSWKQTGQAEWQVWQNASTDPLLFYNSVAGTSVCTLSTAGLLNCVGGLQENGSAVLSGSVTDNYLAKGASGNLVDSTLTSTSADTLVAIQGTSTAGLFGGTNDNTYLMFGANQDIFLRGGKAASTISIGDTTNTGGILIGSSTNTTGIGTSPSPSIQLIVAGTSSRQPLDVVGREGATSGIVARFSSGTSGSAAMLQLSDGFTYNWGVGTSSGADFEIRTNTFAGAAGTPWFRIAGSNGDTTVLGNFDVDGDNSYFGSANYIYFQANQINSQYDADANANLAINYHGFQNGTTRTRDTEIYDGEQNLIAKFQGSDKSSSFNGQVFAGDTAASSIANNVDVLTVGNTGTGQTATHNLVKLSDSSTIADASSIDVRGEDISLTTGRGNCETCGTVNLYGMRSIVAWSGSNTTNVTVYGGRFSASGGATNRALITDDGNVYLNSNSGVTSIGTAPNASFALKVGGNGWFTGTMSIDGAALLSSTLGLAGDFAINTNKFNVAASTGDTDVAGTLDVAGLGTFANGVAGINNYAGKHLEWSEEWIWANASDAVQGSTLIISASGSCTNGASVSARPGIYSCSTTTGATNRASWWSSPVYEFDGGNWTSKTVVMFPTLSTSSEEYAFISGFGDTTTSATQSTGCWFVYDRGNTVAGGVNAGNANKWEAMCGNAGTRTRVLLDGTSQDGAGGAGAITTVDSAVAAGTWPSTNVYKLEVRMTGTSSAEFWINDTLRTTLTTNIPSTAIRQGFGIYKSNGTTARTFEIDNSSVAVDLTAARSP